MPTAAASARRARLWGIYALVRSLDEARAAIEGGARVVQVRVKNAPAGEVLDVARAIVKLSKDRALVIVNDRVDLALLSGADGVHLGDEDLPVPEARRLLGPELLVGRTCRTLEEAEAAIAAGADHVGYGPVFASRTKPLAIAPRGVRALSDVCARLPAPVVAISGIDLSNVTEVARAGSSCAAVVEAIFGKGDPRENAARLAAAFELGRAAPAPSGRGGRP